MNEFQKRKKVKEFVDFWKKHSKVEKQDDQTFWNMFLRDILDINEPEKIIKYQAETDSNKTNWIDAWIKNTGVIIEQKSSGVDLLKPTKQSDGTYKDAFEQAKNYDNNMNKYNKSNWIITCNFDKFLIYDMNNIKRKYLEVNLEDLPSCYDNFRFMVDKNAILHDLEVSVSKEAGKIIGNIYEEIETILKEYNMNTPERQKDLNAFCVRLVFCCFAEDSGLFIKGQFRDFIEKTDINHLQSDLLALFEVLNQKERNPFLREELRSFPYVNGELFAEKIDIPPLNENVKKYILEDACDGFDWSKINPTIFGAIFESTLNPETRRSGGMHYTSIENIHKVIDPLFLDSLKKEFSDIRKSSQANKKLERLEGLQDKISKLLFLDPACGSGNFLTETYLELRRLENNIIREKININKGQTALFYGKDNELIKVHIQQFFGIEINDFAVAVSKTALWIAEYQMWLETKDLDYNNCLHDFLPLDSYENIIEANALRMDWNEVVPNTKCNYIMGNPPFVGTKLMTDEQRDDRLLIFDSDKYGKLDYVSCWYKKSADYMISTEIKAALVSTNSISQGEQTSLLWKLLFNNGIYINFAHRTFIWNSEASIKAHVHCVIIGFSYINNEEKMIFENNRMIKVKNINGYLVDAPNIFIEKVQKPLFGAKEMTKGSQLIDGGYFVFEPDNKEKFIRQYPESEPYFYEYINADSFLNNREIKFCLCLKNCPNTIIKNCKGLYEIVNNVYNYRANSRAVSTKKLRDRPTEFFITNIPNGDSLLIPIVSSERRKYIPLGFIKDKCIYTNATNYVDNASLFDFGLFISNVHMAWMRAVAGRLKSDYRYSKDLVYNTFPIPEINKEQKEKIEKTAQMILDARAKYPKSSLAELYDDLTMPPDLRTAHQLNDKAVMNAYGFSIKMTESECVSKLMEMYEKSVSESSN